MSLIFLDTSPLIYYLDGSEPYASKTEQFLLSAMNNGKDLCTYAVTDTEYFVHPYREHNLQKISVYKSFFKDANILIVSAIESDCNMFLTNDKQLK